MLDTQDMLFLYSLKNRDREMEMIKPWGFRKWLIFAFWLWLGISISWWTVPVICFGAYMYVPLRSKRRET